MQYEKGVKVLKSPKIAKPCTGVFKRAKVRLENHHFIYYPDIQISGYKNEMRQIGLSRQTDTENSGHFGRLTVLMELTACIS